MGLLSVNTINTTNLQTINPVDKTMTLVWPYYESPSCESKREDAV